MIFLPTVDYADRSPARRCVACPHTAYCCRTEAGQSCLVKICVVVLAGLDHTAVYPSSPLLLFVCHGAHVFLRGVVMHVEYLHGLKLA